MVKFLSKSDNFLAQLLNYLKGPSVEYLILLFFELTHMYFKQKPRRLSGALTLELGPTVWGTVISIFLNLYALEIQKWMFDNLYSYRKIICS